jgi:hypothetical protein
MTATYRLKGLGWLAICVVAVLGFYMVSLQVSVERKKLETVNHEIARAHRDIRSLQTEFATRANLAQLEQWNGQVLALTAPTPAQYLPDQQALASLTPYDMPGAAQVETAQLVIPTLPVMAPPPDAVQADAPSAPTRAPAAAPARTPAPVEVASIKPVKDRVAVAMKDVLARAAAPAHRSIADKAKGEAMAMLDRKLLSDATLGDLTRGARAETASLR